MSTGFTHLDGRPGDPWAPARPRGVTHAALMLVALFFVFSIVVRILVGPYFADFPASGDFVRFGLFIASIFVGMGCMVAAFSLIVDRRPPDALGLRIEPQAARILPLLGLGALCAAPAALWYMIQDGAPTRTFVSLYVLAPFAIVFAGVEELIFRGWLLQTIAARHGVRIAVLGSAAIFALAHLEAHQTGLGMVMSVAARLPAGVVFAILALRYGNLWGAIGFHAGWNACLWTHDFVRATLTHRSFWGGVFERSPPMHAQDLLDPELAVLLLALALQMLVVIVIAMPTWRAVFGRNAS